MSKSSAIAKDILDEIERCVRDREAITLGSIEAIVDRHIMARPPNHDFGKLVRKSADAIPVPAVQGIPDSWIEEYYRGLERNREPEFIVGGGGMRIAEDGSIVGAPVAVATDKEQTWGGLTGKNPLYERMLPLSVAESYSPFVQEYESTMRSLPRDDDAKDQ